MKPFAALLEALLFNPSRTGKLRLLAHYFSTTPDPDRGWALAALTGTLDLTTAKPAMVRLLVAERVDPVLFELSYDFVGDLAETVALIWPAPALRHNEPAPSLGAVIEALNTAPRADVPTLIAHWLDLLDAGGRLALLKLVTGGLRVGISARLAKTGLARLRGQNAADAADEDANLAIIEELWHGLKPPYADLFAWLEARAPAPNLGAQPVFRPVMLAQPLEEGDLQQITPDTHAAEWKWDGVRVQAVATHGQRRLYTRTGEDISTSFPDLVAAIPDNVVLDGELLVMRDGLVAPFSDLQQRLNRTRVSPKQMRDFPAHLRVYDLLLDAEEDVRPLPLRQRRARLQQWMQARAPIRLDLSPLVPFSTLDDLVQYRAAARAASIEGLMIKRWDSPYVAGRPKGPWLKWKRAALTADCVLMYAQRGHGKRSGSYSDFTFGAWANDGALVPVGKAYSGFTDEELNQLDKWVKSHATERFGPVRALPPQLVVEVAFDAIQLSSRHKSGLAMRFPRFHRIRWDKPADEADRVETLRGLVES